MVKREIIAAGMANGPNTRGFAIVLGALLVVCFPGVLLGSHSFVLRDYGLFGYPLAHHLRECFWNGELPLWNPYHHCGMPFLAQWNTLCLYPLSLIYVLLPLAWGLGLFCVVHLFAGGLGMFCLARDRTGCSWAGSTAGVLYAFNGLVQTSLMWPNNIAAFGALPWVLLLADRAIRCGGRWIPGAAMVGGLQMLCGAPELIAMTWILAGAECLIRNGGGKWQWLRLGLVVVWVSILASAQLLPFLDLLIQSHRGGDGEGGWAMAADGWKQLFVPLFRSIRAPAGFWVQSDQFWTLSYYPGIISWVCALISLRHRLHRREVVLWWVLALTGLALASGGGGWLYPIVNAVLPLGWMRYPVKFVAVLSVAVPLLAAHGVSTLPMWNGNRCGWLRLPIALPCLLVVLVMVQIPEAEEFGEWRRDWMDSAMVRLGWLVALTCILVAATFLRKVIFLAALPILGWLDLRFHSPDLTPTVPVHVLAAQPSIDWPRLGQGRIAVSRSVEGVLRRGMTESHAQERHLRCKTGLPNLNLIYGAPSVGGFYSLRLAREQEVERRLHQKATEVQGPLADFMGVKRVSVAEAGALLWRERVGTEPLITIGREVRLAEAQETLHHLASDAFRPSQEILLSPKEAGTPRYGSDPGASIENVTWSNGRVEFVATANQSTVAVIAQSWHPNWKAEVDGKPSDVLRVNHAFQGVVVPQGKHEIALKYMDSKLRLGFVASALGWIGVMGAFAVVGKQERETQCMDSPRTPPSA